MDIDEKLKLLQEVGEEIIEESELKKLFLEKKTLSHMTDLNLLEKFILLKGFFVQLI